jgi:hypothetical protein
MWTNPSGDMAGISTDYGASAGTFTVSFKAENKGIFSEPLTFTVNVVEPPQITTTELPDGQVGYGYGCYGIQADRDVYWSVVEMPAGLYLGYSYYWTYNQICGYPETAGKHNITLKVADDNGFNTTKTFTINIDLQQPEITDFYVPSEGWVGEYYSAAFEADQYVEWKLEGDVPPGFGLAYHVYNSYNYIIVSQVTAPPKTYNFTVVATNAGGLQDSRDITLTISEQRAPEITYFYLPTGYKGKSYDGYLEATDLYAEWKIISGELPSGLNLDKDYGDIYGTPTEIGTSKFTVVATNDKGQSSEPVEFSITIEEPLQPIITTYTLPDGEKNKYYDWTQIATVTHSSNSDISLSGLPSGLYVTKNGFCGGGDCSFVYYNVYIEGNVWESGSFDITIEAVNGDKTASETVSLYIAEPSAPQITTIELQDGKVGEGYGCYEIQADKSAYWSVEEMPAGLNLSYHGWGLYNQICGTPAKGTAGSQNITLKVEDVYGYSSTKTFTISIAPATPPVITVVSSPSTGKVGTAYNASFTANQTVTWSLSGNVPDGLGIDASGTISGTPTTAGNYTFKVVATNDTWGSSAEESIAITVNDAPPVIAATVLDNGEYNIAYSQQLNAASATDITWSIASGKLPTGLSLNASGLISGKPTELGTSDFTVKAANFGNSAEQAFSITIDNVAPVISTLTLGSGEVDAPYSRQLASSAGTGITWSIIGSLPTGLSLSAATISGTPTTAGDFTFTVKAANSNPAGISDEKEFTITVVPAQLPTITTTALPDGTVGISYSIGLKSQSQSAAWSLTTGTLPTGLSLSAAGTISGTPTAAGDFTFTVKAANSTGEDTKQLSIKVVLPAPPTITTTALPNGKVNVSYSNRLTATGTGHPAITWKLQEGDELPDGLTLNEASGIISGTPTKAGTFEFTVIATGTANISSQKDLAIVIEAAATPTAPQISSTNRNVRAYAANSSIVLENLPANAKVEVYSLQGKLIHSANPENHENMRIMVQTKGMYIVKISGVGALRVSVK